MNNTTLKEEKNIYLCNYHLHIKYVDLGRGIYHKYIAQRATKCTEEK